MSISFLSSVSVLWFILVGNFPDRAAHWINLFISNKGFCQHIHVLWIIVTIINWYLRSLHLQFFNIETEVVLRNVNSWSSLKSYHKNLQNTRLTFHIVYSVTSALQFVFYTIFPCSVFYKFISRTRRKLHSPLYNRK